LFYGDPPLEQAADFAAALLPHLPTRMYAHLGVDIVGEFEQRFRVERRGLCQQMQLKHPERLPIAGDETAVLTPEDARELGSFYERHYPDTAFDPSMLSTKQLRVVRREGTILSVAGLHVYSDTYRVAALGNVATAPAFRRLGLGRRVSAALCRSLMDSGIETIGLDVMVDNSPAIAMWESLGFEAGLAFQTCMLDALAPPAPATAAVATVVAGAQSRQDEDLQDEGEPDDRTEGEIVDHDEQREQAQVDYHETEHEGPLDLAGLLKLRRRRPP
jgi:ribosomal protein S18 acetylase RimI-like enzyme